MSNPRWPSHFQFAVNCSLFSVEWKVISFQNNFHFVRFLAHPSICLADNFFQLSYRYIDNRVPSHWFAMTGETFKFDRFEPISSSPQHKEEKAAEKKWLRIWFCRIKSRCADLKEIKLNVITALEHSQPITYFGGYFFLLFSSFCFLFTSFLFFSIVFLCLSRIFISLLLKSDHNSLSWATRSIDRFNTFEVDQSVFELRKRKKKKKKKTIRKLFDRNCGFVLTIHLTNP